MITLKCQECGNDFPAQRTSAKFCSTKCRVKFNSKEGEEVSKEDNGIFFVPETPLIIAESNPIENPLAKIKGVFLGSELTKTATKSVFQLLLIEFNKYAMNDVPAKDCKKELLALKEKSSHHNLNYRQKEAILERVDHYLNGTYGTSFNENNAYKNH